MSDQSGYSDEPQPSETTLQFMLLGPKGNPIPVTEMRPDDERDNPLILNSFEEAVRFYNWMHKTGKANTEDYPVWIVELVTVVNYDTGIIDDEGLAPLAEGLAKIKMFGECEQDYWDMKFALSDATAILTATLKKLEAQGNDTSR